MPRNPKEWMMLTLSLVMSLSIGVLQSAFSLMSSSTWYAFIEKPDFAPPDYLFIPLWLIIYTAIAFALFLVWRESTWRIDVKLGIRWYLLQLFFNGLWAIVFFGLQEPYYALIIILLLCVSSLLTTIYFFRVSVISGCLMVIYLFFFAYMGVLNLVVWLLN